MRQGTHHVTNRPGIAPAHWSTVSRCIAAAVGGYALANALSIAIVALAPLLGIGALARADAVLVAMSLSFVVYTAAVMWAFAASSAMAAWAWLGLLTALSSVAAWALL